MLMVFHHNVQIFIRCYGPHVLPVRIAHVQHIVVSVPGFPLLLIIPGVGIRRNIFILKRIVI